MGGIITFGLEIDWIKYYTVNNLTLHKDKYKYRIKHFFVAAQLGIKVVKYCNVWVVF